MGLRHCRHVTCNHYGLRTRSTAHAHNYCSNHWLTISAFKGIAVSFSAVAFRHCYLNLKEREPETSTGKERARDLYWKRESQRPLLEEREPETSTEQDKPDTTNPFAKRKWKTVSKHFFHIQNANRHF